MAESAAARPSRRSPEADALVLFWIFLKATVLSVGALSGLPLLHQDLVATGRATEQQFIEALAIGRLSTGPNGLYVISLGYFVLGWLGALVALLAAVLPPLVLVPAAAVLRRQLLSPWFAGLVRGVAISTSGLVIATGIRLIAPGATPSPWQIAVAIVATALTVQGGVHPALLIGAGALVGIILGR